MLIGLIQAEYIWILLFYRLKKVRRSYRRGLKIATIFSRMAQIVLQVIMLSILGVNRVNTPIKAITLGLSIFQIIYNAIYSVVLTK